MNIGKKISRIREIFGIKQEALAMSLQVSQQQVSRLELSEEIEAETLRKIAAALGLSVNAIQQFDEQLLQQHILSGNSRSFDYTGLNFHPLQKIVELYEDKVKLLERLLEQAK